MKDVLKICVLILLIVEPFSASAVTLEAKVLRTGMYGDGEKQRFDVPGSHPQGTRWFVGGRSQTNIVTLTGA